MQNLDSNTNGKCLLSLTEAGNITGISHWSLRNEVARGILPCFRRSEKRGKIFISREDLTAYLDKCRIPAHQEAAQPQPTAEGLN